MQIFALRLSPNQDLKQSLQSFARVQGIEAGFIVTTVGSLKQATLRFANHAETTQFTEHFEIVSLTGTVSVHGSHLHIAIADSTGRTIGGHVMDGCLIYTTAEIILGEVVDLKFTRPLDAETGYHELNISPRSNL
jgi:hypothetical protein